MSAPGAPLQALFVDGNRLGSPHGYSEFSPKEWQCLDHPGFWWWWAPLLWLGKVRLALLHQVTQLDALGKSQILFASLPWCKHRLKHYLMSRTDCRSLKDIFHEKIPEVDSCTLEGDVNVEKKHIVSPELISGPMPATSSGWSTLLLSRIHLRSREELFIDNSTLTWWIPLPARKTHCARDLWSSWRFGMPDSHQARSMAVPGAQATFQREP